MQWSKYNYIYKSKLHNAIFLYNSLSNSFVNLDNENIIRAINHIKNNLTNFDSASNPDFFNSLVKAKIINESDELEVLKIKHQILKNRYSTYTKTLTILPTLLCNFKCPYCFAGTGMENFLNDEIENRIIKHIQNNIKIHKTGLLNITWMGGEPLLNFKRIKTITDKIRTLDIKLNAGLVTNGYLLTKEKIIEFENLCINYIQITLDGLSSEHNKTRVHKTKKDTFSKIIKNIELFFKLQAKSEKIGLNIRVNLSKSDDYINKFAKLYKFLKQKFPFPNLYITPGFIEDLSSNGYGCNFDRSMIKKFYLEISQKFKMHEYSPYPKNKLIECAIRSENTLVIGPSGELYSCWDYIGKNSNIIGQLMDNGEIQINNDLNYIKYLVGADYLNDQNCLKCFFFPICNGGCPEKRIRNKYENANFDCCAVQKDNLDEILDCHYSTKLHQNNNLSKNNNLSI